MYKINKHIAHYVFANTHCCWQHCITHPRCQPVFPDSTFLFQYNKLLAVHWNWQTSFRDMSAKN